MAVLQPKTVRLSDVVVTALAPTVWGSTYIVTTEMLPAGYPLTLAVLRALPAGLLLLAATRTLPPRAWIGRITILGALNFAFFWFCLFVTAYRLPGGVAATLGATQAVLTLAMARAWLGTPVRTGATMSAVAAVFGVGLLLFAPAGDLDPVGILAGLGGAASMAAGTVLSRKWQPPVSSLVFTAWQLTAGGILLIPAALLLEPPLPPLSPANLAGLLWLGLIGAAVSYILWFRGVARLEPGAVSLIGTMSPVSAVLLGWVILGQALTPLQAVGAAIVLTAVVLGQRANRPHGDNRSGTPSARTHLRLKADKRSRPCPAPPCPAP